MKELALYFPDGGIADTWGVAVTACGNMQTGSGQPYPPNPGEHPGDHLFWLPRGGRILDCYQLLYLSAGRGVFESAATGLVEVASGSAFLLFPGIWHRYSPAPETGWRESFLEMRGPALDRLREQGVLRPEAAVFRPGEGSEWTDAFSRITRLGQEGGVGAHEEMSTLGMYLLAKMIYARSDRELTVEERAVRQAEARMRVRLGAPLSMSALAAELGVDYDVFRRCFKALTGLAPKQYLRQLQMRRTEELLLQTRRTVEEIAEELGFNTAFHLSAAFKQHAGMAPSHWRAAKRGAIEPRREAEASSCRQL